MKHELLKERTRLKSELKKVAIQFKNIGFLNPKYGKLNSKKTKILNALEEIEKISRERIK